MAKTISGMDALIPEIPTPQPVKEKPREVTTNYIMSIEQHRKLKMIAAREGKKMKEVLAEAIEVYLTQKE